MPRTWLCNEDPAKTEKCAKCSTISLIQDSATYSGARLETTPTTNVLRRISCSAHRLCNEDRSTTKVQIRLVEFLLISLHLTSDIKKSLSLIIFIVIFIECTKNSNKMVQPSITNLIPLKVGNEWIYSNTSYNQNGDSIGTFEESMKVDDSINIHNETWFKGVFKQEGFIVLQRIEFISDCFQQIHNTRLSMELRR